MNKLKNRLDFVIRKLNDLKSSIPDDKDKLGSHPDHYPGGYFHHSDWDCKKSPTKYCMYTVDFDSCIFCYEPDERK